MNYSSHNQGACFRSDAFEGKRGGTCEGRAEGRGFDANAILQMSRENNAATRRHGMQMGFRQWGRGGRGEKTQDGASFEPIKWKFESTRGWAGGTAANSYSSFLTRLQTVCLNPNLNSFSSEHTCTPTHAHTHTHTHFPWNTTEKNSV